MIYRFPLRDVKDMLLNQIGNNFFKSIDDERLITKHMERTLERLDRNISANDNKYYWRLNAAGEREAYFDPLHTCQWMLFLYLTANTIFREEKDNPEAARVVCDKIYGQIYVMLRLAKTVRDIKLSKSKKEKGGLSNESKEVENESSWSCSSSYGCRRSTYSVGY